MTWAYLLESLSQNTQDLYFAPWGLEFHLSILVSILQNLYPRFRARNQFILQIHVSRLKKIMPVTIFHYEENVRYGKGSPFSP